MGCSIRLLRRLLVLGIGAFSVWLIAFVIFPIADNRLPWILAAALTYGIAAYIVLPRTVRMSLKVLQRKRVPRYTITGDGLPGDPVNLEADVMMKFFEQRQKKSEPAFELTLDYLIANGY